MVDAGSDFQTKDSFENVISLTNHEPLIGFAEMWYNVFLWALFSSIFVHVLAGLIAFCRLRKHKIGRWISVIILAMGVLSPLTGGVITSAAIAGFYRGSDFQMKPFYAFCWGISQTVIVVVISFTRIPSTL